jgi:hypothetical protein
VALMGLGDRTAARGHLDTCLQLERDPGRRAQAAEMRGRLSSDGAGGQ